MAGGGPEPRRRAAAAAGAALLYLLMAWAWALPSSARPLERVPDLGDPLHLAWTMAWDVHAATTLVSPYDANAFHPYPRSLTFADHLFPEALLVSPVLLLTGNAVLASNVGVVLALAMSAFAMFLLVRDLLDSDAAALVAGGVYAFNAFTQHELPRVHVLNVQWWPLALLGLHRWRGSGSWRHAGLVAAALTLQGLSGTYYLVYTAILLPAWLAVVVLAGRTRPTRRGLMRLGTCLALAAVCGAAVLWPYVVQFREMGFEKGRAGGADLVSYLAPPAGAVVFPVQLAMVPSETPHFAGWIALLLAFAGGVVLSRAPAAGYRPIVFAALLAALAGFLLSLGPVVHVAGHRIGTGPYELLYRLVRPLRGMAGPERFGVLVPLGLAPLAALGARAALGRLGPVSRPLAAGVVLVLLAFEQWVPPGAAADIPSGARVPAVYRWLATEGTGPVVELPLYPDRARKQWAAYLYFSTYHWRRVPVGRTSFYPPAHDFLTRMLEGFPDETSLAALEKLGIGTVVVHPRLWRAPERDQRIAALDAHSRLRLLRAFDDPPDPRDFVLGLGGERAYGLDGGHAAAAPCTPSSPVPRTSWTLRSSGVTREEAARDGERRTAWRTARPQRPGDYIEVAFPPREVAAVGLGLAYPYDEFLRHPVVIVEGEDGVRRRVPFDDGPDAQLAVLDALLQNPRQAAWVLRIPRQRVRAVRVQAGWQEGDPSWPAWSLPELELYSECR